MLVDYVHRLHYIQIEVCRLSTTIRIDQYIARTISAGQMRMNAHIKLFANAKTREYSSQQIITGKLTSDFGKGILHLQ